VIVAILARVPRLRTWRILLFAATLASVTACAPDRVVSDAGVDDDGGVDDGPPVPLDDDQIRRGTAVVATTDVPPLRDGLVPAPPTGTVLVDVGATETGDDGTSGTFVVDVDERIVGLTVVVVGQPDALVLLTQATAPDGTAVIDDQPPPPDTPGLSQAAGLSRGFTAQFFSPGRVLPARHVGAFALPSTADIALVPGAWTFRVGHFRVALDDAGRAVPSPLPRPLHVFVLVRTVAASPGRVGLALHFSGAGGLTAAAASTSPVFADALSVTRDVWGAHGIDVDDVVSDDLDDGAAFRTIVLDTPNCDGGDLDDLVTHGTPDRVNVFFVDRFECGNVGPFLLGMSPGIPGVPWTSVAPSSGVVIAGTFLSTDPDKLAVTMAHEIGHWLGLFHSQENDRFGAALYDNVDDTGEAPASRENLMFFDVSRIGARALSNGQARTVQRGPVVLP
jgi:hypothetical protein